MLFVIADARRWEVPAALYEYTPSLIVGGTVIDSSETVLAAGEPCTVQITFDAPHHELTVGSTVLAGADSVIVVDVGKMSFEDEHRALSEIGEPDQSNAFTNDQQDSILRFLGTHFFHQLDVAYESVADLVLAG